MTELEKQIKQKLRARNPVANISPAMKTAFEHIVAGSTVEEAAKAAGIEAASVKSRFYEAEQLAALMIIRKAWREQQRDKLFKKPLELAGVIEGVPPAASEKDQLLAVAKALEIVGDNYRAALYERSVEIRKEGIDVPILDGFANQSPHSEHMPQLVMVVGGHDKAASAVTIEHDADVAKEK